MSQVGSFGGGVIPPGTYVETLTANSGGAVSPSAGGNINVLGSGNIDIVGNPGTNTLTASITGVIPIANGGTNASSMTNTYGVNYFDGTRIVTTTVGTATHVLTSNGVGVAPTFQAVPVNSNYIYTNVNTTPYVVLATDEYISVDCSGAPITIQLPNAATSGRAYIIKDRTGSANTNAITVTTVGGAVTIDGATSYTMNTQHASIQVIGSGSAYEIF